MKKSCAICNENSEVPTKAQIYFPNGELQRLTLCANHDLELYRLGQISFFIKHRLQLVKIQTDDASPAKFKITDIP